MRRPTQMAFNGLPHEYRGRGRVPRLIQLPLVQTPPKWRQGDFEPAWECTTVQSTRWVKQCRRVQSLARQIAQTKRRGDATGRHWQQWKLEWECIMRSKVFKPDFEAWLAENPEIEVCRHAIPDSDQLWQMQQLLQHQANMHITFERTR